MASKIREIKTSWDVLMHLPLRYEGYAILEHVLKRNDSDRETGKIIQSLYFDVDEWAQRWHLFAYQRAFGKWGYLYGAPDLEECAFRLLMLHLYRETVPHYFRQREWYFDISEKELEEYAAILRREFVPDKADLQGMLAQTEYLWADKTPESLMEQFPKFFERPEVLLAFSVDARFLAENYQSTSDQWWGRDLAQKWVTEAYRDMLFQCDDCANWVTMQCAEWRLLRQPEKFATFQTREHALLMFLYLHLYRLPVPCWARVEPFASLWEKIPEKAKALVAQRFRRKLSEIYIAKNKRNTGPDQNRAKRGRKPPV